MIEITTTGGCEYIFVSLFVTGNNNNIDNNNDNMCGIYLFNITLWSMDTSMTVVVSRVKNNFTELPGNDTLYNVTVIGVDALENFININSTSVVIESKYIHSMCVCTYVYVNVFNVQYLATVCNNHALNYVLM